MTHTRRAPRTTVAVCAVLLAGAAGCAGLQDPDHRAAPGKGSSGIAPPAAGAASAPRGFTLVASGDVIPHGSVINQAAEAGRGRGYDFRPMLAAVGPVVSSADIAVCHMETVYGANGEYTGFPLFKSPPEIAEGLASVGYDSCSTASNHTLDDGTAGVWRTLDALDHAGVQHVGSARTPEEADQPAWLTAGGAKVAQLAYTYGINGYRVPADPPWTVNLIDERQIIDDARAARSAGADVVVVSLHWGTEWQTAPDQRQLDLGRSLTASTTAGRPDIDLILGTHAHVPQAYEKVNGTWIVYGMGDQIAGSMINHLGEQDPRGNESSIARFTFAPPATSNGRWEVTKAEYIPQWMDTVAGRVVNLPDAIRREGPRDDYVTARATISDTVLSRGAAADGLTMGR
ncbi:CapA family protein [Streptomyces sp. NPDC006283]|uniref:CapA family protein n=1 Tax=Streptomyces sp. NPDC006283 TaxID=3156741 RepID=UPI0033B483F4